MRLWMLALACFLVMLGCIAVVWIGALRQSSRHQGNVRNAIGYTLILLVLTAAAARSNLPWNDILSPTAIILFAVAAGVLLAAMYVASLRLRPGQRPARASTNPPVRLDDHPV